MPRSCRGFTMMELIVVISVMGVMATLAMTRSPDRTALHAKGFRDQLVSMLRHARKVAVSQRRDVCVVFAPMPLATQAAGVYANVAGCNPAAPVADPGTGSSFVLDAPQGVVITGPAFVRFNAGGQPVPNANQTITVGTQVFTISRETGTVF